MAKEINKKNNLAKLVRATSFKRGMEKHESSLYYVESLIIKASEKGMTFVEIDTDQLGSTFNTDRFYFIKSVLEMDGFSVKEKRFSNGDYGFFIYW